MCFKYFSIIIHPLNWITCHLPPLFLSAKRLSFNDVEYSADKSYYYLKPHDRILSINSDYKLYDDDPVPFYSRRNRPNYHRYRLQMVHNKSQLSKIRNKNRRSYDGINGDRKGYYNQKGIYLSVHRPSVAFGPPIVKQGIRMLP